jgi:F0F1-type ATP synthase epsilon subunit
MISLVNGSLTVNQAPLTITANNASRTYGSSNPAFTASYNGLVAGDTSSVVSGLSLATGATTGSSIGSYAITALGATAANYAVTLANGTLAVTPASLTITAANASRTYGASNPIFTATYGGLVNGDTSSVVTSLNLTTPATTGTSVGSYAINGTGALAANYNITYVAGTLTIGQAPLTITADNSSRLYGSTNSAFTASYSGLTAGDTSNVVSGLTLSTSATTASTVGTYGIAAANALASNYTIAYVGGTLTVAPAPLTITANNASRLYTDSDPTFTASYSGLVLGQTSSVVSGLQITANDPGNAAIGTNWTITPSGATAANYTISYGTGNLFVGKAYLTITPVDSSRLYGATNPTIIANYTGLQTGDTVSGITYSTAAGITSGVGQYQVTAANATATNYIILYDPGILNVVPAPLTIAANSATRAQNKADPAFTASFNGLVAGDSAAVLHGLSFLSSDQPNSGAGQYTITPYGVVDPNYTITYLAGVLTITPGAQLSSPSSANLAVTNASRAVGSTILAQAVNSQIFDTPISASTFGGMHDATSESQTSPPVLMQGFLAANSQYLLGNHDTVDQNDQALCLKGATGGCSAPLMLHGF